MNQLKIYNFMGLRRYALVFSALLLIASVGSLSTQGLVLGLDFSGGTQIEVGYDEPVQVADLRVKLESAGFESPVVVHFGSETDILIRMQGEPDQGLAQRVYQVLQGDNEQIELRRVDYVGPQIGEELRDQGGLGGGAAAPEPGRRRRRSGAVGPSCGVHRQGDRSEDAWLDRGPPLAAVAGPLFADAVAVRVPRRLWGQRAPRRPGRAVRRGPASGVRRAVGRAHAAWVRAGPASGCPV